MMGASLNPAQLKAIMAQASTQKATQAKSDADMKAVYAAAMPQLRTLVDKGDYAGAWKLATTTGQQGGYPGVTKNPLLMSLETQTGLQQLDPTKKWTQGDIQNFYSAAGQGKQWDANSVLGADPYGGGQSKGTEWNGVGGLKDYANTDFATNKGAAPDLARFAGRQPPASFLAKWGAPIVAAIAACVAPYALPAMAAVMGGTTAAAIGAGAVYGAGVGATGAAVSGGDIGKGALVGGALGGVGGALGAGGISGGAKATLTDVYGVNPTIASGIVGGVQNAGLGAIKGALTGQGAGTGALNGALSGGLGGLATGLAPGLAGATGLGQGTSRALLAGAAGTIPGIINGNSNQAIIGGLQSAGNTVNPVVGIAAGLAGKTILGSPSAPGAPRPVAPGVKPVAPATQPAPVASPTSPAMSQPVLANGYTYSGGPPQTQIKNPIANYATYGQGPEAQFFTGT